MNLDRRPIPSVNDTLIIDMSVSWDPSYNIPWTTIDKGTTYPMDNQVIWIAPNRTSCFGFGGESSARWTWAYGNTTLEPQPVNLYQFNVTGVKNGTWSTINAPSYQSVEGQTQGLIALKRPDRALGEHLGGTGYMVNGIEDKWSQPGFGNLRNGVSYVPHASERVFVSPAKSSQSLWRV